MVMVKRCLSLSLVSLILISVMTAALAAEGSDGPTMSYWPMVGGDQSHTYASKINVTTKAPSLMWDIEPTGSSIINYGHFLTATTPVIGPDGSIYVASSSGNISAIDPNGSIKWMMHVDGHPYMSPAIDLEGSLIFGVNIYKNCTGSNIYSLSSNGSLNWKLVLDEGNPYSFTIGPDGTIFTSAAKNTQEVDGNWTRENVTAIAINRNGTVRWKIDFPPDWAKTPVLSSDGKVYLLTGSNLYAINSNGLVNWTYSIRDTPSYNMSQALVTKEGCIEFVSESCLHRVFSNGTSAWKVNISGKTGQFADLIYDGSTGNTYVLTDGQLTAFDQNGTIVWRVLNHWLHTSYEPVISGNGQIITFTGSELTSYNSIDGSQLWKCELTPGSFCGPSGISIGSNGTIYLTRDDDQTGSLHLYAFNNVEEQAKTDDSSVLLTLSVSLIAIIALLVFFDWKAKKR